MSSCMRLVFSYLEDFFSQPAFQNGERQKDESSVGGLGDVHGEVRCCHGQAVEVGDVVRPGQRVKYSVEDGSQHIRIQTTRHRTAFQ